MKHKMNGLTKIERPIVKISRGSSSNVICNLTPAWVNRTLRVSKNLNSFAVPQKINCRFFKFVLTSERKEGGAICALHSKNMVCHIRLYGV